MKTQIEIISSKIFTDWIEFGRQVEVWKFQNKKIVFTNGCFDILHLGHVEYLAQASDLGDILIIGMNTDSSVKKIKGDGRPVNDEKARGMLLSALRFVDAVILFDQETPYELIQLVRPDVLVKGGDYKENEIVGYDVVKENGGEVVTIELVPGYSTTGIIDKISE